MGRFTSVQTYSDQASDKRTISYEQASGGNDGGRLVKPEKVVNPYGSTAGAGSGEFHVYRAARAREMQRQSEMEKSAAEKEKDETFNRQRDEAARECEERTAKRRAKRQKQKAARERKRNLEKAGISVAQIEKQPADEEDFTYIPEKDRGCESGHSTSKANLGCNRDKLQDEDLLVNDGSFLERAKKKLKESEKLLSV